jgi:hypothetical protein
MTTEQIATVKAMLVAGRLYVGWDDPKGPLARIVGIEDRDGVAAGVCDDGEWVSLTDADPVEIVAYFRPFAVL